MSVEYMDEFGRTRLLAGGSVHRECAFCIRGFGVRCAAPISAVAFGAAAPVNFRSVQLGAPPRVARLRRASAVHRKGRRRPSLPAAAVESGELYGHVRTAGAERSPFNCEVPVGEPATSSAAARDAARADVLAKREAKSAAARAKAAAAAVRAARGVDPARIAVVGGGLAGLATAYHLVHSTERVARLRGMDAARIRVTIFDSGAPGMPAGASAAAAGLLHPFTPRSKRRAWLAARGIDAARALIDAAQAFATDGPIVRTTGLLRIALNDKQSNDFAVAERRYPGELQQCTPQELVDLLPDPPLERSALLASRAAVVDTPGYLRALWTACHATGRVAWHQHRIEHFEYLFEEFDSVVVCAGAGIRAISNLASLPILACRGQNLVLRPRRLPGGSPSPPPLPVISGKYLIPDLFQGSGSLLAGATFEYCDDSKQDPLEFAAGITPTNMEHAVRELSEPLHALSPMLFDLWEPVGVTCGVRALPPRSTNGSIPIAGEILGAPPGKSAWLFTGLGSRGLLHHAILGKLVARAVISGSEEHIPAEARRVQLSFSALARSFDPCNAYKVADRPSPTKSELASGVAKTNLIHGA